MLELLSPAGSTEAVIAAVQSGADAVYIGYGASSPGESEKELTPEELSACLRYCRIRGCRAAVMLGERVTDDAVDTVVGRAVYAAREGADALMVNDPGLITVLREVLPDMPLWGGFGLDIHSADGAMAAAALGLSRLLLAPELSLEQVGQIARNTPAETAVLVHGPLCTGHLGQCYMGAVSDGHAGDGALRCAEPCRGTFSLGGRMDNRPLSMPDICLAEHIEQLQALGVTCAAIGGRGRGPEYVAFVTEMYGRIIREKALPAEDEKEQLLELFAPYGLCEGAFAEVQPAEQAADAGTKRARARGRAEIRRGYMEGERRRVPVTFYVMIRQGKTALFAAEDDRGSRAVYEGYAPIDLGRQGITAEHVQEIMYRTGGTPYNCVGVRCIIDPHMDYADEELEVARRALLGQITEKYKKPQPVTVCTYESDPAPAPRVEAPGMIVQVSRAEQLTAALAGTGPDRLYVPAEILAAGRADLGPFREKGIPVCAVLPRVITDEEKPTLQELLAALRSIGIREALIGSLGLLPAVLEAGFVPRGDFGLNVTNSPALARMAQVGFASVTASIELSVKQIAAMASRADTEMIVYGRVPVMIAETCLIRASSGRCACATPSSMSDPFGNIWPVEKELSCRNIIYDRNKIFLADRTGVYSQIGLWGARLLFTTESARECADVAARYRGLNRYEPNNISRGLYPKGAL